MTSGISASHQKLLFGFEYQREAPIYLYYIWYCGQIWAFENLLKMDSQVAEKVFAINNHGIWRAYTQTDNLLKVKAKIESLSDELLSAVIDSYIHDYHALKDNSLMVRNEDFLHELIGKFIVVFVLGDSAHALRNKATEARKETETLFQIVNNFLHKKYSSVKNISLYTYDELLASKVLNEEVLRNRERSILTNSGVIPFAEGDDVFKNYLIKHNIELIEQQRKGDIRISGTAASLGKATGTVRIITRVADLQKIQSGDVLVSTMTSPKYITAIKKVVAIITDEGGIVSHAAIIARELGIPCIVGTKIATKRLKSGDNVEVDATNGVVKLLN